MPRKNVTRESAKTRTSREAVGAVDAPRERIHSSESAARGPIGARPAAAAKPRLVIQDHVGLMVALGLVAITVAIYAPVLHHQFVFLDDVGYVTGNQKVLAGLTWNGVAWAFTTGHVSNWHPLTWLSHMLDVQLFGVTAGAHHGVSLALHVMNTLLLFIVLRRMTSATLASGFVAALFAVHPLHVESVAWIAERKDVLSTLFWLLTMWAYTWYVKAADGPSHAPSRLARSARYAAVVVCFALGLMAKPMLVTLPFVLLLLDYWPLGRVGPRTEARGLREEVQGLRAWWPLVAEKLPLMLLAAASSIVTIAVQRGGGAVGELREFPLASRLANSLVAYVAYLGKTVWPTGLTVFYPYPTAPRVVAATLALVALVACTVLVLRAARTRPWLAVGWLWYLGTLVPVIGLVQVGRQSMADRYTYIPLIGIFVMIAWGIPDLIARWPRWRRALPLFAAIAIALCTVTTHAQVRYWENNLALWNHDLHVDPDNYYAHTGLGFFDQEAGRNAEAVEHFTRAIRLAPDFPQAHHGLGQALAAQGRLQEAAAQYEMALQLQPSLPETQASFGRVLALLGRTDEGIAHCRDAVRLAPDDPKVREYVDVTLADIHNTRGFWLADQGRMEEAIPEFREAIRLRPNVERPHYFLGLALGATGHFDEAASEFNEVLRLNPGNTDARRGLDRLATRLHGQGGR